MHAKREGKRFLNPVPTKMGDFSIMLKIGPNSFSARPLARPNTAGPFPYRQHHLWRTARIRPARHLVWTLRFPARNRRRAHPHRSVWDERAAPVKWAAPNAFSRQPSRFRNCRPSTSFSSRTITLITWGKAPSASLPAWRVSRTRAGSRLWAWPKSFRPSASRPTDAPNSTGLTAWRSARSKSWPCCPSFFRPQSLQPISNSVGFLRAHRPAPPRLLRRRFRQLEEGFREIGSQYGPFDLTMLEIGASNPLWPTSIWVLRAQCALFALSAATACSCRFTGPVRPRPSPLGRAHRIHVLPGRLSLWSPTPGQPTEVVRTSRSAPIVAQGRQLANDLTSWR